MTTLKTLFFLGKGGTGKSTSSALIALELAQKGKKTLLASFDDAHNQSDIFETSFSDKAKKMGSYLEVLQVDRDREIKKYLKETARKVKGSYAYLTAFNLGNYFDILKHSPGMEEYALVTAFMSLHKKYKNFDYLIIDMPPTALSLRFFNLPSLSLTWVDQLEKLRMEIQERKETITRIKLPGKEIELDKVLSRIREIKSEYQVIKAIFEDSGKSKFFVVFNPDVLSMAETTRIHDQLTPLNINIRGLICNHRMEARPEENPFKNKLAAIPFKKIPFSPNQLIGESALNAHLTASKLNFDDFLTD